jgi:exopolyphosphatase/guanosine-5'-triphosphate,3'-diphosphate pyrophosphatase
VRLAAIDVGSNSIHMVIAQADPDGGITNLWRMKEMVGLGRISFPSKRLTKDAVDRAVSVLDRFQVAAAQRQVEKVITVATSAVREAENGGDFLVRVQRQLGLNVRIISAREEARLIYVAVRHAIDLGRQPHLIIDIGGGSVEFIVGDARQAQMLESRKLGAARMTASLVKSDPISEGDRAALLGHFAKELGGVLRQIHELKPVKVIGTSGTLENIAAMCAAHRPADNGRPPAPVIDREALDALVADLLKSSSTDRERMAGLDDQRRDQIIAGTLLVQYLFDELNLKRLQICPAALREGVILDYLSRHVPDITIRREVPDLRRRSVIDLARRCHWHKSHSEQVAGVCLQLFDQTKSLHGLGGGERELIEYAALLHDVGWHIGSKSHHKHSMYLILNGDLRGFTPAEVAIIANIARYHRKSPPKLKHAEYQALPPRSKRIVDLGAALLRLADGLDRSHCSVVRDVRCRIAKKKVECTISARADAELELWGARRKRGMFEDVLDHKIEFELGA